MSKPSIFKKLIPLIYGTAGAGLGALAGNKAMPAVMGYSDDPKAVHTSTALNTIQGLVLGLLAARSGGVIKSMQALYQNPKLLSLGAAGEAGLEMIPFAQSEIRKAVKPAPLAPTMSEQAASLLGTNTAKGALSGAAGAGLLGLGSGLLRRKNDEEETRESSRSSMVSKDILKYLIPAMLTGGLVGSLVKKQPQTP